MELTLYIRPSRLTPNSLFNFPFLPEQKAPPGCEPGALTFMLKVSVFISHTIEILSPSAV